MPSFSHSVDISKPPEEVFPWLLEEDKVPQWTSDLDAYDVHGPLGEGARVVQTLSIAGGLKLDLEITRYDPPRGAESRVRDQRHQAHHGYELAPNGGGTRLTQTLDAKAGGITARMLIPVVQGRLEKKVTQDLERLKGVLEADARSLARLCPARARRTGGGAGLHGRGRAPDRPRLRRSAGRAGERGRCGRAAQRDRRQADLHRGAARRAPSRAAPAGR